MTESCFISVSKKTFWEIRFLLNKNNKNCSFLSTLNAVQKCFIHFIIWVIILLLIAETNTKHFFLNPKNLAFKITFLKTRKF